MKNYTAWITLESRSYEGILHESHTCGTQLQKSLKIDGIHNVQKGQYLKRDGI